MRFKTLMLLCTFALAGCESKAKKIERLQAQYNAEYPAYAKDCVDVETDGAARLLTGQKLSDEEMATLETRKKERDARCKPQADQLAEIQRQILAAQQ
ncbi:MAG: hypothetical protein ABSF70_14190 [Terracidiphilus sp.]